MKNFITFFSFIIVSMNLSASVDVVYGIDNRAEVYESRNYLYRKLARSTAGMVHISLFTQSQNKNLFDLKTNLTLEKAENLCSGEKFAQQSLAPICSGFLVGPDTLITAGHCYDSQHNTPEQACKQFAWLFDYALTSPFKEPHKNISLNNIYLCKQVIVAKKDSSYDFAIIKLDRPVEGREPLRFRTTGSVSKNDPLVVIGHPSGLPTKIADGAKVTNERRGTNFFSATVDTFQGNSGSAVFNARSGLVEGILVMGKIDYTTISPKGANGRECQIVNKCDDSAMNCIEEDNSLGLINGELITKINVIHNYLRR